MKPRIKMAAAVLASSFAAASVVYLAADIRDARIYAQALPTHHLPQSKDGNVVVQLCDGSTTAEVPGLKPGQRMTHAQAQEFSRKLMAMWQAKHPGQKWVMAQAASATPPQPPASTDSGKAKGQGKTAGTNSNSAAKLKSQQGDTYASFHKRDFVIWKAETDAFVEKGDKIFHSAQLLGSTIGVSCDMCHPNAANTHPETYPKYQVQLQRVALLRDMINWCLENPVRAATLAPNDPKMRALEAYILAQRKGVPLAYGKH